jgi:hypothetical protein
LVTAKTICLVTKYERIAVIFIRLCKYWLRSQKCILYIQCTVLQLQENLSKAMYAKTKKNSMELLQHCKV